MIEHSVFSSSYSSQKRRKISSDVGCHNTWPSMTSALHKTTVQSHQKLSKYRPFHELNWRLLETGTHTQHEGDIRKCLAYQNNPIQHGFFPSIGSVQSLLWRRRSKKPNKYTHRKWHALDPSACIADTAAVPFSGQPSPLENSFCYPLADGALQNNAKMAKQLNEA